jgi:hypothetical protein
MEGIRKRMLQFNIEKRGCSTGEPRKMEQCICLERRNFLKSAGLKTKRKKIMKR